MAKVKRRVSIDDLLAQDDLKSLAQQLVNKNPAWAIVITPNSNNDGVIIVGHAGIDTIEELGILQLAEQIVIQAHLDNGEIDVERDDT